MAALGDRSSPDTVTVGPTTDVTVTTTSSRTAQPATTSATDTNIASTAPIRR